MEVNNQVPVMALAVGLQPICDDFGDEIVHLAWGAERGWSNPPLWTFKKRRETETDLGLVSTRSDTSRV